MCYSHRRRGKTESTPIDKDKLCPFKVNANMDSDTGKWRITVCKLTHSCGNLKRSRSYRGSKLLHASDPIQSTLNALESVSTGAAKAVQAAAENSLGIKMKRGIAHNIVSAKFPDTVVEDFLFLASYFDAMRAKDPEGTYVIDLLQTPDGPVFQRA